MTEPKPLGVGLIGMQPGRSWGAVAHVPALRALAGFEPVALSTTRAASAKAAGEALGIAACYDNHHDLIADPAVDIVAVTVKVPHHFELVNAAIEAGKRVYCEWPLGNGLDEAVAMARKARKLGIACAAGMQARVSPAAAYVRDLVAEGYVGEVLSTTLIGSGMAWGPATDNANAYTNDKANGATMLSIPIGHTMDAVCAALGEVTEVSAVMANRRTAVLNMESGESIPMTSADQVAFTGRLASGAVIAVHYRGGMAKGTNLLWEINGSEGDLQVTSFGGHLQIFPAALGGAKGDAQAVVPLEVPERYLTAPPGLGMEAVNVAHAWAAWGADLADGGHRMPTFDDAVRRHRLIAAIERSAVNGTREQVQ